MKVEQNFLCLVLKNSKDLWFIEFTQIIITALLDCNVQPSHMHQKDQSNWSIAHVAAVSCENSWCLVHCSFLVSALKAKFSNLSTQCSKRRLSSSWPHFSVLNTHLVNSVSLPSGRTDPVPIILKYDVMGMGRMEMEVLNSLLL